MKYFLHILNFLLNIALFISSSAYPAVIAGTMIKTPNGQILVDNLKIGDYVIGCTPDKKNLTIKITHIEPGTTGSLSIINTTSGELIIAAHDQLFFDPVQKKWIEACNLTTSNVLLNSSHQVCPCSRIVHVNAAAKTYKISLEAPHVFFASDSQILTHNEVIFITTGSLLLAKVCTVIATTASAALVGWAAYDISQKIAESQTEDSAFAKNSGSRNKNRSRSNQNFNQLPQEPEDDPNDNKNRIINALTKAEFFRRIKESFEHYKNGVYQRTPHATGPGSLIDKAIRYLKWDHLHNDVEAYSAGESHLGSLDPQTLKLYKPAVPGRRAF